jgi:hypothetical protein
MINEELDEQKKVTIKSNNYEIELFEITPQKTEINYSRYPKYEAQFLINKKEAGVPGKIFQISEVNEVILVTWNIWITDKNVKFVTDPEHQKALKGFDGTRNIWAFNKKGEKLWEIEGAVESIVRQRVEKEGYPRERFYKEDGITIRGYDTYTGYGIGKLGTEHEGKIFVGTSGCFDGELNIKTGKVSNWIQGK